jgi:hypothetical protein
VQGNSAVKVNAMSNECVVAVYDSFERARDAVQALDESHFPADQVSLVTHSVAEEGIPDEELQHGDKAELNAAKGAGMGGLFGALLGAPLLAVPGVGPVLIAGPLAMGLTGAIVGGFLGSMSGWGVHDNHLRNYESKVAEGALLVIANGDPQQVASAERILMQTDPAEIFLHAETSADNVDP